MFLSWDQLQKQLDNKEFQEIGSMSAFKVLQTQFQMFIKSRFYLDDEYVDMIRNKFLQYTRLDIPEFRDNDPTHGILDASSVIIEAMGQESKRAGYKQQIREQQHTAATAFINDGELTRYAEMSWTYCLCLPKLNVDRLSELSYQSLSLNWPRSSMFTRRLIATDQSSVFMAMMSVHISTGLVLHQMTSDHNRSELGIQDHSNEQSSSKLVPKFVPKANKTATSRQELELQFHHHIEMLRTTEHPSDTNVFTMKMEILLEPASNKLLVGADKSNITRKQSKTGKHGHENQKSTKE
ncbi:hypothetical protein Tco_0795956 [Tanacetum coccineum]